MVEIIMMLVAVGTGWYLSKLHYDIKRTEKNAMNGIRKIADEIIQEFPELSNDIEDAWSTMQNSIENGESKIEEQDLFYWYIHKLKRGEQLSSL